MLQSEGDTTLIGDAPEGASNVSEDSFGSTAPEGASEPEGPDSGRGTSSQVRFVKLLKLQNYVINVHFSKSFFKQEFYLCLQI